MSTIIKAEEARTILGVEGRASALTVREREKPGCFCKQVWSASRDIVFNGKRGEISVRLDFNDFSSNGHNTFAITGQITLRYSDPVACGCIHEEIAENFPELAPLIKWHLCSTDGPMHYFANTLYNAGDRDHKGLRKDEFRQRTSRAGIPLWVPAYPNVAISDRSPVASSEKPEPVTFEYEPLVEIGAGKPRELDKARETALWPEATDQDLMSDDLEAKLMARLPQLLADFKKAMVEDCGFLWSSEEVKSND